MAILKPYVNLIGPTGNFEIDTDGDGAADGWFKAWEGAYEISDTNFTMGLRSQRVYSKATDTSAYARFVQKLSVPWEANKFYLIAVDAYTDGSAHSSLRINFGGFPMASTITTGKYHFHYFIVYLPFGGTDGAIELYNLTPNPQESWVDFDGLRMYEITEVEANMIQYSRGIDVASRYKYTETSFMGTNLDAFNTDTPLLGETLYERLPNVYHVEDAKQRPTPFPLKRFFQIAGVGLEFLKEKIDGHMRMYDPLTCPPELLPYLFRLYGFEPPNFLSEDRRRAFLKVLPTLYQTKGSKKVFEYLGRTIFGQDTEFIAASREGNNIIIDLSVVLNGAAPDLDVKTEQFRYLAERFRPVNRSLNVVAILMYYDEFDREITEEEAQTLLTILETDDEYNRAVKAADDYFMEQLITTDADTYTLPTEEAYDYAIITMDVESDAYAAAKSDSYEDVLIQTNVVGRGVLGKMRIGNKNTIIGTYQG